MDIKISLETEPKGYAFLQGEKLTLFFNSINEIPLGSDYVPFSRIEDVIEVHEKIHSITKIKNDKIVDSWHILLCRLLSDRENCDCPINCFWRDVYE